MKFVPSFLWCNADSVVYRCIINVKIVQACCTIPGLPNVGIATGGWGERGGGGMVIVPNMQKRGLSPIT